MRISLDRTITRDFRASLRREWLETNGLGGWASSTISGAHSRRYHGLLVAAAKPPVGRTVLLSKLEEALEIDGKRIELGCNVYPGAIHPKGYEYLESFTKDLFPVFVYKAEGIHLQKTIAAVHGENTTLVIYQVLDAASSFSFELLPLVAGRDYHSLTHVNDVIRREAGFDNHIFHVRSYDGIPELFIATPGGSYEPKPYWFFNFQYVVEQARGLDFSEDLFNYGVFKWTLKAGDIIPIIISTLDPAGRNAVELLYKERERRVSIIDRLPAKNSISTALALAADQFVVRRGEDLRTIIAGYHWFTDWGRDTMVALPGITLVNGRFDDARSILRAFSESVSRGMLPNRFPDTGQAAEYNTVDAALWFFVAVHKYLQYTNDQQFVLSLLPVLNDIIEWHCRGTRYNIHVDADGLLYAGQAGIQLTWMDAKIGDWVVTPRQGKAVEINALWYNALKIISDISSQTGAEEIALNYERRAGQAKERFNEVFWNEEDQCLFDYIDGDYRDGAIRPNQIFALSLPFPLLSNERALAVLEVVEKELLTPFGLRSLSPRHPDYRPRYAGDQFSRDSAYHQGTVWGWLLGPFISALVRVRGPAGKSQAKEIIKNLACHFSDAGIGTVSEIFDADPPHEPCGCVAQAWSVAEVMRAYLEDVL